jgi:hypothetical protein
VTSPTKRFYVDPLYAADAIPPFVEQFHTPGVADVTVAPTIYDREEGFEIPCFDLCPPPLATILAYEVNVLSFVVNANAVFISGTPSTVLGSRLTFSALNPYGSAGMATIDLVNADGGHFLPGGIDADGAAITLSGLPVDGFMVYNIVNAQAQPGMLANYSGAFPHRATASCVGPAGECPQVITAEH